MGESLFRRREQWIRTSSGFLNGGGHPIEKFVLKDIFVWDGGNIHPGRFIGVDPQATNSLCTPLTTKHITTAHDRYNNNRATTHASHHQTQQKVVHLFSARHSLTNRQKTFWQISFTQIHKLSHSPVPAKSSLSRNQYFARKSSKKGGRKKQKRENIV